MAIYISSKEEMLTILKIIALEGGNYDHLQELRCFFTLRFFNDNVRFFVLKDQQKKFS